MTTGEVGLQSALRRGIALVEKDDYVQGYELLSAVYTELSESPADGLSHFAVCIALLEKKYKPAIRLCHLALDTQFYQPAHYVNAVKVYLAAGSRRKAVEVLEQGMKRLPKDESLQLIRDRIGYRRRPVIPFLSRDNSLNIALGKSRARRAGVAAAATVALTDTDDSRDSARGPLFWLGVAAAGAVYIALLVWLYLAISQ